jgi:outer membrane protein OmpA-like peptidoglycan-associated protein
MKLINRKLTTLTLSGLLALATIHPAHADDWLPAKKGATMLGATAAGVALGGPFGMIAGALAGVWMMETQDAAADGEISQDQLAVANMELRESRTEIVHLEGQLDDARETTEQYAQLVLDQLQLEMLFKTDATELTPAGHMRLATLAAFLVANPQIDIRLDGYADPRGAASYNQQLSLGRVSHVARALSDLGVDDLRIQSFSHGASDSVSPSGDYDAYALERAVKINLTQPGATGIAQTD